MGIQNIAESVAEQIKAQDSKANHHTRVYHEVTRSLEERASLIERGTPLCRRRLSSQPEEVQTCQNEHKGPHFKGGQDEMTGEMILGRLI